MTSEKSSPTAAQIEALFESTEQAIIDFGLAGRRGEHAQNWHALRIASDGSSYTSTEVSPCYSESEYYGRTPHTLTLISKPGDCWSPSAGEGNPGWAENEDGTLDLTDWCGDALDADQISDGWRAKLQAWIDAGNFCPKAE